MARIRFTSLPDKLKYPPNDRARLSSLHSDIITYISEHFCNTSSYKNSVIHLMNVISFLILSGDSIPNNWSPNDPFKYTPYVDKDALKTFLSKKGIYIDIKDIDWDLEDTESDDSSDNFDKFGPDSSQYKPKQVISNVAKPVSRKSSIPKVTKIESTTTNLNQTHKEDLYIRPPVVPQFDYNNPWLQYVSDNHVYTIYPSLPVVPTKQNEISVTTDVEKMSSNELINLYPNHFIGTRAAVMYQNYSDLNTDDKLGVILPIKGYSVKQLKDNIVRYPHIFRLLRNVDGQLRSFYKDIEIDGVLYSTLDIWDDLPESSKIPKTSEFIKEYVVRRYLLERDIKNVDHRYPIFGSLDPFLTLFDTPEAYATWGYKDAESIAKQCVKSRVAYKQSRNPIMRRFENA